MNFNIKTFLFCLFIICNVANCEELQHVFNASIKETIVIESQYDDLTFLSPEPFKPDPSRLFCSSISLENKGSRTLNNLLPKIDNSSIFTLRELANIVKEHKNPLQFLSGLWKNSVKPVEQIDYQNLSPLECLNFTGACLTQDYNRLFYQLCNQVGLAIRPAIIHGKDCCDIFVNGTWKFLDPLSSQLYLGLDNVSLVSYEEVADDPFLALRTKHDRYSTTMDFVKAWQELAKFEIIEPTSGEPLDGIKAINEEMAPNPSGFSLYPEEKLHYQYETHEYANSCRINQTVKLNERLSNFIYESPFPIIEINNFTNHSIAIESLNLVLNPGERLKIKNLTTFSLKIDSSAENNNGQIQIVSLAAWMACPHLHKGLNEFNLGSEENPTEVDLTIHINPTLKDLAIPTLRVLNRFSVFTESSPYFHVDCKDDILPEKIWWQISPSENFDLIPSNFEQVEPFNEQIAVNLITETFLNSGQTYFFRVKGSYNGTWGEWTPPFAFSMQKPSSISGIRFTRLEKGIYEISWSPLPGDVKYLIFGSNSLDFVPDIYFDQQIDSMIDGEILSGQLNYNLVAITDDTNIVVDGSLAYYRIIAKQGELYSVPSSIIHVYDLNLFQPRTVLQMVEQNESHVIMERQPLEFGYKWLKEYKAKPPITKNNLFDDDFNSSNGFFRSLRGLSMDYTPSPFVPVDAWEQVKPYLLPENHPAKSKLDRIFSSDRVTLNNKTFKKAGFKRNRMGKMSMMASANPRVPGYYVKAYPDSETRITQEWVRWINRIKGVQAVERCIVRHQYQSIFKVPRKWIYPLPPHPSPPKSPKYLRKNFVLIAEEMDTFSHDTNSTLYKKKMTKHLAESLYTVFHEEGLWDSVFAFNVPYCKDGRLAFIDNEYYHKWPVPMEKMIKWFSPEMGMYWRHLMNERGSDNPHISVP